MNTCVLVIRKCRGWILRHLFDGMPSQDHMHYTCLVAPRPHSLCGSARSPSDVMPRRVFEHEACLRIPLELERYTTRACGTLAVRTDQVMNNLSSILDL